MKRIINVIIISCIVPLCQSFDKGNSSAIVHIHKDIKVAQPDSKINGNDCDMIVNNERKKVSLESINDEYLKKILQGFYITVKLDSTDNKIYRDIAINNPNIDSNSVLYFKIDTGIAKGYEIKITGKDFNKNNHIVNPSYYCFIDNQVLWGTDGELPLEEIDIFDIKYFGSKILVPKKDYCNLYNPLRFGGAISHGCILGDRYKKFVIFILFGSDGAGSYVAYFIFKDGKYLMRKIRKILC
jgi:hypothetical protein